MINVAAVDSYHFAGFRCVLGNDALDPQTLKLLANAVYNSGDGGVNEVLVFRQPTIETRESGLVGSGTVLLRHSGPCCRRP